MDFLRELHARLFGEDEQPADEPPAEVPDDPDALTPATDLAAPDDLTPPIPEDNLVPPAPEDNLTPLSPLSGAERGETDGVADPTEQSDEVTKATGDLANLPLSVPDDLTSPSELHGANIGCADVISGAERGVEREIDLAPEGEVVPAPQAEGEDAPEAEAETVLDVSGEAPPEAPDEAAPDAPPFADAVPARQERAAGRILDDEGLRGDLTDDEYQPLLDWALTQTDALAAATEALDDEQAETVIEAGLVAIRDALRAAQDSHAAPTLGDETA